MPGFGIWEISFWHSAAKVLAVLSGLLGTFFLGIHFLKKSRAFHRVEPRRIRILETHRLTPKTALHLVAVGRARILLGETGERLTLLTALPPKSAEEPEESSEVPLAAGKTG